MFPSIVLINCKVFFLVKLIVDDWCRKHPDVFITAIGVKNGIFEGCKCQAVLSKAVSNNIFSVWLELRVSWLLDIF